MNSSSMNLTTQGNNFKKQIRGHINTYCSDYHRTTMHHQSNSNRGNLKATEGDTFITISILETVHPFSIEEEDTTGHQANTQP